jgi:transposase InsO family protein
MTGKRIGDHQVGIYKKHRTKLSQEVAAAKVGISARSARRLDGLTERPSQREARSWRTRADPFEVIWQSERVPMREATPALTAMTLLEEMQRRYPGKYDDALLCTLQRRVRTWNACFGKEREVFFAQKHPPGRLGLSDFTHAAVLKVTMGGAVLLHVLYQFALAYSGWRYVEIVLGGESFAALSSGLQNAVWRMGGVPEEHRTDSLAAAFNNHAEHELLTRRYEALCTHYGMRPSRNNLGVSHENGSIESRQGTLKRTLEQALLLRGHRKFNEERGLLKALPVRRSSDYEEEDVGVTKYSTLTVTKVLYTVPSRRVGHRLKVRVYSERLECCLGNVCVFERRRGPPGVTGRRSRVVDYRHLLPALKRKPGALARSVVLDDLFPRTEYRQMWAQLKDRLTEAAACRLMVGLLDLAGNGGCEAEWAQRLASLLESGQRPDLAQRQTERVPREAECPAVAVVLPSLASYDQRLQEVA